MGRALGIRLQVGESALQAGLLPEGFRVVSNSRAFLTDLHSLPEGKAQSSLHKLMGGWDCDSSGAMGHSSLNVRDLEVVWFHPSLSTEFTGSTRYLLLAPSPESLHGGRPSPHGEQSPEGPPSGEHSLATAWEPKNGNPWPLRKQLFRLSSLLRGCIPLGLVEPASAMLLMCLRVATQLVLLRAHYVHEGPLCTWY